MKRLLVILLALVLGYSASAQTVRYRASQYAVADVDRYGNYVWGDWQDCNIIITIDYDNDFIKVYTKREQNYVIVEVEDAYNDSLGGESVDMTAIDEEGIECNMTLRVQDDGVIQLYSYYSNVAWVYSDLVQL